jgi:glucose-1-phosphate thymidylyltransferase
VWGIVPAAGVGSRIQPLAFSKELLPVGSRVEGDAERPRAVSEYLVERMVLGGADRICFVIAPGKSDILEYYGARPVGAHLCYTVQPSPGGLCDAIFRAVPFIGEEESVLVGLPDTIWFPAHALRELPDAPLSFLLFPVDHPALFDAVLADPGGQVREIRVKQPDPGTEWIWGAFRLAGRTLHALHRLWLERDRQDEYIGTLVNSWLAQGGSAVAVRAGTTYMDVGTLHGYRQAMELLRGQARADGPETGAVA